MAQKFITACIQNNATPDVDHNIDVCTGLARQAAAEGAKLIATPEYFSGLETKDALFNPAAFYEEEHPVLPAFQQLSMELGIWSLLGSLGVKTPDGRINNRSYLIGSDGSIVARYDKIHMFDVELTPGKFYTESATIQPGSKAVVADTPWGGLGMSVCYDLRFAALYRALAHDGASILSVPAAFTKVTGQAHWHVLNRARAIEHGCFVIAPCQYGSIVGGGECYGHSLIIDPWGEVLADGGDNEGLAIAELDMERISEVRRKVPALTHDRLIDKSNAALAAE